MNNTYASLGVEAGSVGAVTVTGTGSRWTNSEWLALGREGTGSMKISDGGAVSNSWATVNAGGSVLVTGAGASWTSTLDLIVGTFGGMGTLTIADGGAVSSATQGIVVLPGNEITSLCPPLCPGGTLIPETIIGQREGSTGTVLVTGTNSILNSRADVIVGGAGTGVLAIADHGRVAVSGLNDGPTAIYLGRDAGSTGTLVIGAPTGEAVQAAGIVEADRISFGNGEGTLLFNHAGSTTFAAAIGASPGATGSHRVDHRAGVTTLTGDTSSFNGMTTVHGGSLLVGVGGVGALGGTMLVESGGTLGGSGLVGSVGSVVRVANGGILAPGQALGTLNVAGDLTFDAGSFYQVEVNAAGEADRIIVAGTATIDGGQVQVLAGIGDYAPATTYTILTGQAARSGEFASVWSNFAFLDPSLSYDANNVYLTMTRNAVTFDNVGITPNQIAAGSGTESLASGNTVFDAVIDLSADQARTAFDQLSGEIHASARTALIEDSRFVRHAVWNRLRAAENDSAGGAWGQAFGSWGHTGGDGNAARLDRSTGGLLIGADGAASDVLRFGAVLGYNRTDIDVDRRGSSGKIDSYHLGAYAGGAWGPASIRAGVAYGWHDVHTTRDLSLPGFSDTARAGYDADTLQAFGELAYAFDPGSTPVEPFANITHLSVRTDAFAETGGAARLAGDESSTSATFSTLGLRTAAGFDLGSADATFRLGAGWRHALSDTTPIARMRYLAGGDRFRIAGLPVTRNAATIEAELDAAASNNVRLGLSYSGQFGSGLSDQSAKASLIVGF